MKAEERTIRASIIAGLADMLIGLIFFATGFGDWYYEKFHVFGILGIGMVLYGVSHYVLYKRDMNV